MPESSHDPVTLITGAGSGIGRAVALELAARGHRLALLGRTEATLRETARLTREIDPGAPEPFVLTLDLTAPDPGAAAHVAIEAVIERFERLDVLVNNAGFAPLVPLEKMEPDLLREVFRINAFAPGSLMLRAWPHLTTRHPGPARGLPGPAIVNLSTMGTKDPFPGFFAYAAAKAAVESFVRSAAGEGARHGLIAYAVAPGAVETPMLRSNFDEGVIPPSATLDPTDVARVVVACAHGERSEPSGSTIYLASPDPHAPPD